MFGIIKKLFNKNKKPLPVRPNSVGTSRTYSPTECPHQKPPTVGPNIKKTEDVQGKLNLEPSRKKRRLLLNREVSEIKYFLKKRSGEVSQKELAKYYKVHNSTISNIATGLTHHDIPMFTRLSSKHPLLNRKGQK